MPGGVSRTLGGGGKHVITKSSGKNTTISKGVDVGPVSVSAQSGWNRATKVVYKVKKKTKYCWSSPEGPLQSAWIEFRKPTTQTEPCRRLRAHCRTEAE